MAATFSGSGGSPRGRAWLRVRTPRGRLARDRFPARAHQGELRAAPAHIKDQEVRGREHFRSQGGEHAGEGQPGLGLGIQHLDGQPQGIPHLIQEELPVPGLAQGLGAHGPANRNLMGRHDLLKGLERFQGPGHALRGQVPGGSQPLPQPGNFPAVGQDPEFSPGGRSATARRTVRLPRSRAAKRRG